MDKEIKDILVIGDSLCRGVVLNEARRKYCFLDECFVNIVKKGIRPALHNASKFGTTVQYGRQTLEKHLAKNPCDAVFVEFGGNDCDYDWESIATNPAAEHIPNTPLHLFEKSLCDMIDIAKDAGAVPVLMTLPPLNALAYFRWFTKGDEEKGRNILKWLGDVWRIYWWQERYSAMVRTVAENKQAFCIDARSAFLRKKDFCNLICLDGIHPNPSGHTLIASEIFRFIGRVAAQLILPAPLPAVT